MKTPGGGGYGRPRDEKSDYRHDKSETSETNKGVKQAAFTERGSVFEYRQAQESV